MPTIDRQLSKAPKTIQSLLVKYRDQIEAALPRHLTPERIGRLALTSIRRNYRLGQADPVSLFGAVIECSQLGLEPGRGAHLVPFKNNKRKTIEVQMIPDYRGLMDLARRGGGVGEFYAQEVRAGDEFDFRYGTAKYLHHKPCASRGEITHFYAVAGAPAGNWNQFEVMSKPEVDEIRARSRASDDGPWVTDYAAMGRKTVIKRLCKMLPCSPELMQAIQMDDQHARGISQANSAVIDAAFLAEEEEGGDAEEEGSTTRGVSALKETLKGRVPSRREEEQAFAEQNAGPPLTAEEIAASIKCAQTLDDLDQAGDLVGSVEDKAARASLTSAYLEARGKLTAAA